MENDNMNDTPSPSFRVELDNKDNGDTIKNKAKRNRISVGSVGLKTFKRLWQPHNFRVYFSFDKRFFDTKKLGEGRFNYKNHDSESEHKDLIEGCRITVKKNQVEVINLNHPDKWWLIIVQSDEELKDRISQIVDTFTYGCVKALKKLIKLYGGESDLNSMNIKYVESGISGDKEIDSIPSRLVYTDFPFTKKWYAKKLESFGVHNTMQYFRNRMLENYCPDIVDEIENLEYAINPVSFLKVRIHSIDQLWEYEGKIRPLHEDQKLELELYLFSLA